MAKKKKRKKPPSFGSGILTDSYSPAESGKINAQGIFTLFWAWDFPCHRRCAAIITLFDIPKRKTKVVASLKKKGAKAKKISELFVKLQEGTPSLVHTIPLIFKLTSQGTYELLFTIPNTHSTLKIQFEVRKKDWPEFTKTERDIAKSVPHSIKSIRANVVCDSCSYAYVFEESLLETPPSGGIQRFPESGKFKCKQCNRTFSVRDLQGQLRASLKEQVKQAMRRRP